ncbi:MAG: hypothetical protein QOJ02_3219 [Acidobacteriota bacterium]|jgi:hypothetical protein|nr:hypothetical protein [Acidobacteriota bacterium]
MTQVEDTFSGIRLIRILKGVCFILIITLLGFLFRHSTTLSFSLNQLLPVLATASAVILLGLAGLYLYAAKFYNDIFYNYLSVGWLAIAVYVFLDTFFQTSEIALDYDLELYGLSIISIVPFRLGCCPTSCAASSLSPVFGYLHAPFAEVEDLSPDNHLLLAVMELLATAHASFRRVNDELVGLSNLPESHSAMAGLSSNFQSRLPPQRASAPGFLPRQIKRGRHG